MFKHLVTVLLAALSVTTPLKSDICAETVFSEIYDEALWGCDLEGYGTSGTGSLPETTVEYRAYLQQFLKDHDIKSVVDVGCGDWQVGRLIDWTGIDYIDFDVVPEVVETNQERYGNDHIRFIHADATKSELPLADLFICKDVMQHLPFEDIYLLINQFPKFKYCLITNDVNPETLSSKNYQICRGGARSIDLTTRPFFVKGEKVLNYIAKEKTKQILLIVR